MTTWVLPDAAFSGSSKTDDLSYMIRRIGAAYSWPGSKGTTRLSEIRTSTGSTLYLMMTDTDYADLVSKSSGVVGLSATEQTNKVTSAPAGDAANSTVPIGNILGMQAKAVPYIGDSLTNGVVVTHTPGQKLHDQCVVSNFPFYVSYATPGRDYSYNQSQYNSFNYGIDSQQIANPNGQPSGDWVTDFPKYLLYFNKGPNQKLIFHVFLGTNDLAHEAGIDPVTEVYTNRLIALLNLIKATYPNSKIVFAKTIARSTTGTLNNRIISYVNAAVAGSPGNKIDAIADYWNVVGTGVWSTVKIVDPANPGVTVSRASASTVSVTNIVTGLLTTAAAHACVTGTPINITSSGVVPTGLSNSTPYYAEVVSTTTLYAHNTLAEALAGTNRIIPSDVGSGTISLATSGDSYYSTDNVHMKPAATILVGAASKVALDTL